MTDSADEINHLPQAGGSQHSAEPASGAATDKVAGSEESVADLTAADEQDRLPEEKMPDKQVRSSLVQRTISLRSKLMQEEASSQPNVDKPTTPQADSKNADAYRELVPGMSGRNTMDRIKFIRGVKRDTALTDYRQATPCKGAWMTTDSTQRFSTCAKCNLMVYDFTGMSPEEAKQMIFQREGLEKVTLYRRADGKFLTRDCPQGSKSKLAVVVLSVVGLAIVTGVLVLATFSSRPKPESSTAVAPPVQEKKEKPDAAFKIKIIAPGEIAAAKPLTPAEQAALKKIKIIPPGQPAPFTPEQEKQIKAAAAKIKIIYPASDYSLRPQNSPPKPQVTPTPASTPESNIEAVPEAIMQPTTSAGSETPEPAAADHQIAAPTTPESKPAASPATLPATHPAEVVPAPQIDSAAVPVEPAEPKHNPYVRDYH